MTHLLNTHSRDEQIDQGLWYLINEIDGDIYLVFNTNVALEKRIHLVQSMYNVWEQIYMSRCTLALSHLHRTKEDSEQVNALNRTCYMWWDIIPLYGKAGKPNRDVLDEHCLDVMEKTLKLDSIACQESALHGLGHWRSAYPEHVHQVISDFLNRTKDIDEALKNYALNARDWYVQ